MRTLKLWVGAVALVIMTFWPEPTRAADSQVTAVAVEAIKTSDVNSGIRGQVVLAGMVALLSALLVLRRSAAGES